MTNPLETQPKPSGIDRGGLLLIVLILLGLLWMVVEFWNFTPDDAYIHFAFMKYLAERGEFSINPGQPTFGTTSPLWILVNAPLVALVTRGFGAASIPTAAKILGLGFAGLTLILAVLLVKRSGGSRLAAGLAALMIACNVWFARWGVSGMESPLVLSLFFGCVVTSRSDRPWIRFGLGGALAGVFPLARPEGIVFLPLFFLHLMVSRSRVRPAQLLLTLLAALLPLGAWLVFAQAHFGSVIPNTVLAKSEGFSLLPSPVWLGRLAAILAAGWLVSVAGLLLCAILFVRRHGNALLGKMLREHFLLWAWPAGLFSGYLLTRSPIVSRYVLMAAPGLTLLFVLCVEGLSLPAARKKSALIVAAAVCVFLNTLVREIKVRPPVREYAENFSRYAMLPQTLRTLAAPGDWLAVGDVGVPAFLADGHYRILDLNGLISPEAIPYKKQERIEALLLERQPRFLIDRAASPRLLIEEHRIQNPPAELPRIAPLARLVESVPLGKAGVAETERLHYSLYELDWGGYPEE